MVYRSSLDATFAALADPTRRAIVSQLAGGDLPIAELAAHFPMTLPAVRKHLAVLERAGLVRVRRVGRLRRTRLNAAPMRAAVSWMERYRVFWEHQFDQIEAALNAMGHERAVPVRRSARTTMRKSRRGRA
jgi:DNA-binding transcriptional ArsR family regulator